jgi:hypothetical protein
MTGDRVDQPDAMSLLGEPGRVDTGAATDVEDRRVRRQVALQQHPGAQQFH